MERFNFTNELVQTTTISSLINSTYISAKTKQLTIEEQLLIVKIRLIVYAYLLLPTAIIGLALNGFTIVVLLHPKMRNSTNSYLTALSIANIICLINFIFLFSLRYMLSNDTFKKNIYLNDNYNEIHPYESFINLIYGVWHPIFTIFQLYAIYLTCAVTVDRWIYLTWPLKVDKICTMKNTMRAIILIFLFCLLYNLPRWFEIESARHVTSRNKTYYQARLTKFGQYPLYNQIMRKYGYTIFVYGIPFLILLIVNIGIIQKLIETKRRKSHLLGKKSNKQDEQQASQKALISENSKAHGQSIKNGAKSRTSPVKLDPKVTLMVLAVVLAFFCCQFPYLIIYILSSYSNEKWFHIAKVICDFLAALNCCINFLIYCLFGQNFRQIAKQLLFNPSFRPYRQPSIRTANRNSTVRQQKLLVTNNANLNKNSSLNNFNSKLDNVETVKLTTYNVTAADASKSNEVNQNS